MIRIAAAAGYLPTWRLQRRTIAEALGQAGGRGSRSVASWDEDTTTMAVEAGRRALGSRSDLPEALGVYLATTAPAYVEKTNATTVHAALGLVPDAFAADLTGSVRSGFGVLRAAVDSAAAGRPALAVVADIRTGRPGSVDESGGGDAGAALLVAEAGEGVADVLAVVSVSEEFLDRWAEPGERRVHRWEEKFGEQVYLRLGRRVAERALEEAGIKGTDVSHLLVTGQSDRAAVSLSRAVEVPLDESVGLLAESVGNSGAAHFGLGLVDVLERAAAGSVILAVSLADGADAVVLRATGARGSAPTVRDQLAASREGLSYTAFLTWRGQLRREPPRRPDPQRPAAPPSLRSEGWKFGFAGSRCRVCGTRHLPPQIVCVECQAVAQMEQVPMADVPGSIATYTIDHLAFTPSPPMVAAVVDFDGGGRFQCELADADVGALSVGDRVQMVFRRRYTADGVHNYFWKAKPHTREVRNVQDTAASVRDGGEP